MLMRSQIEAMRGVMYKTGEYADLAHCHPDPDKRQEAADRLAILTPVCKQWGTDLGVELTSLGMQVHGGMGYIEETGAPQCWRDARIAPIYEGTNGIQAADLVARKLTIGGGSAALALLAEMGEVAAALGSDAALAPIGEALGKAVATLQEAGTHVLTRLAQSPNDALAAATPFTEMFGIVAGGWVHGLSALAARREDPEGKDAFLQAKIGTARFYAAHVLPKVAGLLGEVTAGAESRLRRAGGGDGGGSRTWCHPPRRRTGGRSVSPATAERAQAANPSPPAAAAGETAAGPAGAEGAALRGSAPALPYPSSLSPHERKP